MATKEDSTSLSVGPVNLRTEDPASASINELEELFRQIEGQSEVALAVVDAVTVLCALERAPEHHDTHPSRNITTGAGRAHGLRVANATLPTLLRHARDMIEASCNDADVMHETAIAVIRAMRKAA